MSEPGRTFIDVRFYIDNDEAVEVHQIAAVLVSPFRTEIEKWKVDTYQMLGFGSELADGEVVRWNDPERKRDM